MIDINFDFTTDTPHYWDKGTDAGNADPDSCSATLQEYHKILWSKKLPNGEFMDLKKGKTSLNYLTWKHFRFASDSLVTSFRYKSMQGILTLLQKERSDYQEFMERFVRKSYTIGGMIIFPKHRNSINQLRGTNPQIRDRIDLTVECIRLYYQHKENPLTACLERDADFFDLFVDFKGFIDFFFLQDIVSDDYNSVKLFLGNEAFNCRPLPKNVDEYLLWYKKSVNFIEARNDRIKNYCVEGK